MGQAEKSSRCRPGSSARLRSLYRRLRHSRSESGKGASPRRTSNFSSIKRKEFPLTSAPGRAAVSSGLPTGSHPLNANSGRKANEIRDGTACRLRKGRDPQTVGAVREVRADRSRRRQRDDTSPAAPPHKIRPIRLIGALRRRGARGARELGRALADFHNVERQRGQRFGHSLTCSKTHKNRRFDGPDYRTLDDPDYRTLDDPDYRTFDDPDYRTLEGWCRRDPQSPSGRDYGGTPDGGTRFRCLAPGDRKRAGWHPTGVWDPAGREARASDKGRARSALRSERKPSIIFLRRQAVHPLPRGCRPARSRISLAFRPEFAFWIDYIALPRRSAAAPSRLWTAGCSNAADGSCVLAGPGAGPGRGPKRRLLVKWPE